MVIPPVGKFGRKYSRDRGAIKDCQRMADEGRAVLREALSSTGGITAAS